MPDESQKVTFHDFISMISGSAMVGLGLIPNPMTNKQEIDLRSVQHTISMLEMIQEKTKGNLTQEEETLLEQILHELRMGYVSVLQQQGGEPPEPPKEEEKPSRIIVP